MENFENPVIINEDEWDKRLAEHTAKIQNMSDDDLPF